MSKTLRAGPQSQAGKPAKLSDSGHFGAAVQDDLPGREPGTKPVDRRVRRTQHALHRALIQLVQERGWDAVSVRDVCERADVGRSTFYLHFADKEELLVSGFGDLLVTMRGHAVAAQGEPLAFTTALMEHARQYHPLLRALVGRRTGLAVQRGFMNVVKDLVRDDLRAGGTPSQQQEITVSYVAGALWELLHFWLEQRKPPPVAELAAAFKRLTLPVLRVAPTAP